MPQVNIGGVAEDTGTAIDPDTFMRVAENADIINMIAYDSSPQVDISETVLPQNLQAHLRECEDILGDRCKYVGYDFDDQAATDYIKPIDEDNDQVKLLKLTPFVTPNIGVFVKEDVDTIELSTLPSYDFSYTAYVGTPLQTLTPSLPAPEQCAATCNTLVSCDGFNYNSLTNTCALFPSGTEKDYTDIDVSFHKTCTTRTTATPGRLNYWFYVPGASAVGQKYYTCVSEIGNPDRFKNYCDGEIPTDYCTVWRTPDNQYVTKIPDRFTYWNASQSSIDECNSEILRLLNDNTVVSINTGSLQVCTGLPSRSFQRKSSTFVVTDEGGQGLELNPSTYTSTTSELAYDMLHYGPYPMTNPPNLWTPTGRVLNGTSCSRGERPSFFGCKPCTAPPPNSYWLENTATTWCQYGTCPVDRYIEYGAIPGLFSGNQQPVLGYYCAMAPNGKLVYTDSDGNTYLTDCTNTLDSGSVYDSVGYSSSTSTICPTQWCQIPRYDREIWGPSGCAKIQLDYGWVQGPYGNPYPNMRQCPTLTGPRQFYLSPKTCDQCSVPIGYDRVAASGLRTYYSNGQVYSFTAGGVTTPYTVFSPGSTGYPEYGCLSTPCPRTPDMLANEIWDTASSNLCAIRICSNSDTPDTNQTACVPRPGFTSVCDIDSDCICAIGTTKSGGQCVEKTPLRAGYNYFYAGSSTGNTCTSRLEPRTASQVYSNACVARTCFASTTPETSANPVACVRCPTLPYNSGTTRYGYISNVQGGGIDGVETDPVIGGNLLTGCTLGICPAPPQTTPEVRWKYGEGCDWIQCPRAPSNAMPTDAIAGERWAGDFGCDIVTWTRASGQTACTTYPSAGNQWSDTYSCNIRGCRSMVDLGCDPGFTKMKGPNSKSPYFPDEEDYYCRLVKPATGCPGGTTTFAGDTTYCYKALNTTPALLPNEIWGPGCTKRTPTTSDYIPNTTKKYFLKCTNWPDPGKKFSTTSTTPCTIEPCSFTPIRGYIWKLSTNGTCETEQCPSYTFPDSSGTRCLPCPTDAIPAAGQYSRNYLKYRWQKQTAPTIQDTSPFNNLCRVDGCSEITGQTLAAGEYWSNTCARQTCSPGSEVINRWECTSCSTTLPANNIWTTPGTCAISACGIQRQPNATSNVCVACPSMTLALGYTYTLTDGCTSVACPAIAASNIWIANGSCENTECTGHTQPNAAKSACVACPTPSLGNTWSSTDGCAITACPAIAENHIFTTIGTCASTACPGHTTPDASKMSCDPCPELWFGQLWESANGCGTVACPAIPETHVWTTIGTCDTQVCPLDSLGRREKRDESNNCVPCTPRLLKGNVYTTTDSCAISPCPAIAATNIWTTLGTCDNVACTTGHTRPNSAKLACEPCPDPPLGNTWSFINGCIYKACPSIAAGNVFTTIGTCDNAPCTGRTQLNAARTACDPCPNQYGNTWSSANGCAMTACADILPGNQYISASCTTSPCTASLPANHMWDPRDVRGGCRTTCNVFPGQKVLDQNTCTLVTFKVLMDTPTSNITISRNIGSIASWGAHYGDRPMTHYIGLRNGGSFTFNIGDATHIRIINGSTTYFMRISLGFDVFFYNYDTDIETRLTARDKIYVYFVDNTGAALSTIPAGFNLPSAVMTFGNITQFACDSPATGFVFDVGCNTIECPNTPAPGFLWDPLGGCNIISCNEVGITLGNNEFWSGPDCGKDKCTVGTTPENGICVSCPITPAPGFLWDPLGGCNIISCNEVGITLGNSEAWSEEYYCSKQSTCTITPAANQYYGTAGSCTLSNCAVLAGGQVYSSTRSSLDVCPSITTCSPAAGSNEYYAEPGYTCTLSNCAVLAGGQVYSSTRSSLDVCPSITTCSPAAGSNEYYAEPGYTCTLITFNGSLSVAQGYRLSGSYTNGIPDVVSCPTSLAAGNGWVTDFSGTCAQKALTWTVVATVSTGTTRLQLNRSSQYTSTVGAVARRVANPYGTVTIQHPTTGTSLSSWGSGVPTPGTYTHVRFVLAGNTKELTLQLTTTPTATSTAIYGFFTNDLSAPTSPRNIYAPGGIYFPANYVTGVAYTAIPSGTSTNFANGTLIFGKYV